MDAELARYIIKRVEAIDSKVDQLLEFKWKIVGGSIVMSVIITSLMQVFFHTKGG